MNKKLFFLFSGLLFWGTVVIGQTIQNSVIASTGASTSSGNVKMDYTLGEVVIETFSAGGQTITQGFHQTNLTLVAIENTEMFSEISIYPNPADNLVNIDIPQNYGQMDISIYDASGKLIRNKPNAAGHLTFDVSTLASGIYYLQVLQPENNKLKTFKLVKNQ
ncbi:MAG: hypothetical protein BWY70_01247 [Bacteroidetes bacterium ADurb.Bin408]|nr:MAG: hypothetical protein BWY70_01247 [Bacteroidetes bacterium ADurb.Bin408]